MPGKRSPEKIEQRLQELLSQLTAHLDACPELTFGWSMNDRAARIRYLSPDRVRVEVNLRFARGTEALSEGAWEFRLCACACCIARRLRLEEEAAVSAPRSYLHGLAQIEALHERYISRAGSLSLPPEGRTGRIRLTAADLFCAVAGISQAMEWCGSMLSPEELESQQRMLRELEMLSEVPEVACFGPKVPENSMVWCARTVEKLLERDPALARLPVLSAMCGEQGSICSLAQLMERFTQTGDALCGGIALRLFGFSNRDFTRLLSDKPDIRRSLEEAAHEYRSHSVDFARVCGWAENQILRDNLLGLERMNAHLNAAMERHGMPCQTGLVHPLARD